MRAGTIACVVMVAGLAGAVTAAVQITGVQGTMLGVDNGIVLVNIQTQAKDTIIPKDSMNSLTGGWANNVQVPRFSPDGKQVVFWHDWWLHDWSAKNPGAMYIADNNGRNITKICDAHTDHAGIDYQSLSWCTDGYIYFSRQTDTIFRVSPTAKQVEVYWSNVGVSGYHTGSTGLSDTLLSGPYVENLVVSRTGAIGASSNGGHIHALDIVNKRLIETCGGGCRGGITTDGDYLIHWLTCCGYYPTGYSGNNAFLRVTVFQPMTSCDTGISYMYAPGSADRPDSTALQYWMYRGACNSNDYLAGQGYGNSNGVLQNRHTSDYLVIPSFPATDFYLGALPAPPAATPRIALDSTALNFVAVGSGTPASQVVHVSNAGIGTLTNVTVTDTAAWLTVTRGGSGNSQTLTNAVSTTGLARGAYTATITVSGGGASNSVSYTVTLNVGSAVAAPTNLMATQAAGAQNAIISWHDNASNEVGYLVERKDSTTWRQVRSLPANTTTWTDSDLVAGTHTYRVRAYATGDTSGYSNEATATIVATIVLTLTKPAAGNVLVGKTVSKVQWTAQNSGGVFIQLSLDDGDTWVNLTANRGSIKPSDTDWCSFSWTVPDTASTTCLVQVIEYTNHSVMGTSGQFSIVKSTSVLHGHGYAGGGTLQRVVLNGTTVAIVLPSEAAPGAARTVTVVDSRGRVVGQASSCNAQVALPGRVQTGMYLVKVSLGSGMTVVQKVLLP